MPLSISFSDGSIGKCRLSNASEDYEVLVPSKQMVRRSKSDLNYQCTNKNKDVVVGIIPSSIETEKIAANILFLNVGVLIDAVTEKARTYPTENVIQSPNMKRNYRSGLESFNKGRYTTAFSTLTPVAKSGLANAQYLLGVMYQQGKGVEKNYKRAAKWYQLAADQKLPAAQNHLGYLYHYGKGVPQNLRKAVKFYKLSATQNDNLAFHNLGIVYENGHGVSQDYEKAIKYYKIAAKSGFAESQNEVGLMFLAGLGVSQNFEKAVYWFGLSANQGHVIGQSNLGYMYHFGYGVPVDYRKSLKWYKLAAEAGNGIAQYHLSSMYMNGLGVEPDTMYAYLWSSIAAKNGNKNGSILRDYIAKRMPRNELRVAQEFSHSCFRKNYKNC